MQSNCTFSTQFVTMFSPYMYIVLKWFAKIIGAKQLGKCALTFHSGILVTG